jgi:nicotinamide riboside transporter PnuC
MVCILLLSVVATVVFYFVLKYFGTANIVPSTISVTTSFIAVCFSAKRSPYFALAYAVNDVVLIVLWVLACVVSISYITVVICFTVFLVNDLYSFINWIKMRKKQQANE